MKLSELTQKDVEKLNDELRYRILELRPKYIADVKEARAHGDLSENFEYKAAKLIKNRNDGRIRYIQTLLKNTIIIEDNSDENTVGLYDKVTVYFPEDDEEEIYRIVTEVRYDVSNGFISKESPFGKAVFGKKIGDTCLVESPDSNYTVVIRKIEKADDDDTAPLANY